MLDKIVNSIAPFRGIEFPRADTRIVLTKGNVPHNDFLAIEVNLQNANLSREAIDQFMLQFELPFRRTPDLQQYALSITYDFPKTTVAIVLYVGEDYFKESN